MENKNANRPAFTIATDHNVHAEGLTKREYFAGLAMQGIINAYPPKLNIPENEWSNIDIIGILSVKIADELLKQLNP